MWFLSIIIVSKIAQIIEYIIISIPYNKPQTPYTTRLNTSPILPTVNLLFFLTVFGGGRIYDIISISNIKLRKED